LLNFAIISTQKNPKKHRAKIVNFWERNGIITIHPYLEHIQIKERNEKLNRLKKKKVDEKKLEGGMEGGCMDLDWWILFYFILFY